MSLFPDLPLSTDAHLGTTRPLAAYQEPPRSHLVQQGSAPAPPSAIPSWELERRSLQEQVNYLLRRVERLETYLESRTFTARWARLVAWLRSRFHA